MKYVIAGTNRPGSRTLQIAKIVQATYQEAGESVGLIDLRDLELNGVSGEYGDKAPAAMRAVVEKLNECEGIHIVCPEYNGSYPGALKYFIDHWKYPDTFEFRPIAYVGLGSRFGGLRPIEHLQGVMGFRNAYSYPERVFIFDVSKNLKDGVLDPVYLGFLKSQVTGFKAFCRALSQAGIDANSRLAQKIAAAQTPKA
jgi:chromate reductase, NAD(P)H dehydrogenase (quinone)